jgi:hypothetical protein
MPQLASGMGVVGAKVAGAVPKLIQLGTGFKNDIWPAVKSVAGVLKNDLLPPLVAVGGFIVQHLPLFGTLTGIVLGIVGALKVWAVAQAAINFLMTANPIGLVAVALAGLIVGVVAAYKNFSVFRSIVQGAWSGIQTVIGFAWNNVIQPVFKALSWFMTNVLGPAIGFFWNNIVKPYWTLIGSLIKGVWDRLIYPMFQVFAWTIRNVVAPAISWFYDKVVKPVFGAVGGYFSDTWNKTIKPVFNALGGFIENTVAPAISKGVSKVKGIWDTLQGIFLTPINFLIGTVYNDGIRKVINALPGVDDVAPLALLGGSGPSGGGTKNQKNRGRFAGYARGGAVFGAGSATSDSIPAWLSNGEHVLTAKEVQAAGGHGVIKMFRQWLLKRGMGKTFDPPAFAGGGALTTEQLARAKAFALGNVGDPYVWGGVGPNGFDCSGFMSAITNVIRGKNPFSRVGATGDFPWKGFDKGPGQFTIGSTKNYGGSGVGHMAGTLDGMNVESRGGRGVVTGSAARGYNDSGFNQVYHLGAAGADGGFLASIKTVLKNLKGWVSELASMGGFGGLIQQMVKGVGGQFTSFINGKVPGPGPLSGGIFDNGGILEPGQFAFNASKKPEAVFNNKQFAAYANNNASQAGSGKYEFVITNWDTGTGYFREIADDQIDANNEYNNRRR